MKPSLSSPQRGDSGLLDLLVMLIAVAIVAMVGYAYLNGRAQPRSKRINCINQLKCIGLSARLWSGDNGDKMPGQVSTNAGGMMELVAGGSTVPFFAVMSNEIATPKILICLADSERRWATNFSSLTDSNISYFIVPEADETQPNLWLSGDRNLATNNTPLKPGLLTTPTNRVLSWTAQMHSHQGNISFADGSVQQFTDVSLRTSATNTLSTWLATTNTPFRLAIP